MSTEKNLEPIPAWLSSNVCRAQLLAALSMSAPTAAVLFLLTAVNLLWWAGETESIFVPLFWNALFLFCLYLFGKDLFGAVRVFFSPERSEEVAYLRRLGPLAETVRRIENELVASSNFTYGNDVTFTENWLVISNGRRFSVRSLDELVWGYAKVTTTKLNWILPIWRSHSVVFRATAGPDAESKCSKEWGQKLIAHAEKCCPGIAVGYSEEMNQEWESNRATFNAVVQERKNERGTS